MNDSDEEDQFFGLERKRKKQEKKLLQAKDRSKYKKTDLVKWQAVRKSEQSRVSGEGQLIGRVLSVSSQEILVDCEGKKYQCQLRGLLKKEKSLEKNLIVVGDFVRFTELTESEGSIVCVEERKSFLARADNLSRRKIQLIAANIDQVLITLSVLFPAIKPSLADRYIIAAEKGGMRPVIIINKIDLVLDPKTEEEKKELAIAEEMKKSYQAAGIQVLFVSAETNLGLDDLRALMKDKASVFSGQSGVGKSSLINAMTGLGLRIGDPVEKTKKGSHTTTMAHLIPLAQGGFCIDTPGIKSFGVWNLKREDIEAYFDEIHALGSGCKFPDCHHLHETQCAVKEAVESGALSALRYQSYLMLLETIDITHMRR